MFAGNLYLVATPLKSGKKQSTIEDFFDTKIKSTIVGDKKFDLQNDVDTTTHYGKNVFAHKVVRKQADQIDFSAFNAILSNIAAVIDAHSKKYPVAP